MNSIPQIMELFLTSTAKVLSSADGSDFGHRLELIASANAAMMQGLLADLLHQQDEAIAQTGQRKRDWVVLRRDSRTLTTAFGELRFKRRYYRHRKTGEYAYLLDRYLGIEAYAKVNGDVRQKAVELAEQGPYARSAAAACPGGISRMSVGNYVRELERFPMLETEGECRAVKQLYVEADEDHTALQEGGQAQVKLVYIHEGCIWENGRKKLVNARYATFPLHWDSDRIWKTVDRYICTQYDPETLEQVYLSGDGAPWIRKGEEWLYPCVPVLDSYHTLKALRSLCGGDRKLSAAFMRCVWEDRREDALNLCADMLQSVGEAERKKKQKTADYLLNNWVRIRNQRQPGAVGCSAEGHVSHVLSARLSSRPLGWSKENLMNMAQLRIMRANGQLISYEALRGRRKDAKEINEAERVVHTKHFQNSVTRAGRTCLQGAVKKLPILTNGKNSPLYQCLHGISLCSAVS